MSPQVFKLMRLASGYNQQQLAKELGISHVLVSCMESGQRRITEKVERKFREVANVTVEREVSAKVLIK